MIAKLLGISAPSQAGSAAAHQTHSPLRFNHAFASKLAAWFDLQAIHTVRAGKGATPGARRQAAEHVRAFELAGAQRAAHRLGCVQAQKPSLQRRPSETELVALRLAEFVRVRGAAQCEGGMEGHDVAGR
jgi:hypothetical protein